jgi:uncharacterized cupin superfamily protein
MALTDPVLTGPQDGRTITYGDGSSAELKVQGEQTGGQWAVVEWRVRAGDEGPIHTHTREDETVYVLEGAITAFVGDQQIEVEAGSYGALPKGLRAPARRRSVHRASPWHPIHRGRHLHGPQQRFARDAAVVMALTAYQAPLYHDRGQTSAHNPRGSGFPDRPRT